MIIEEIPIQRIDTSGANTRKDLNAGTEDSTLDDLAASIQEKGLINPITVLEKNGRYDLVAGQRRYLACKLLGWRTIPSIVRTDLKDVDARVLSLIENVHRADLSPMDKANAYQQIYEMYRTYDKVSKETGVSIPTVKRYMFLLKLAPSIQEILTTTDGVAGICTLSKLAEMFPRFEDQEAIYEQIRGFRQQVQLEIIKRSDGDIDKIDGLCQAAMGGCFNVIICHGLDDCPHIPKECLEEVKTMIATAKHMRKLETEAE